MRVNVHFGVLLFAAITSAEFHPTMKEVNIKSPFDRKRFNSKIQNGFPAEDGQFPFVVRVFIGDGIFCNAGTLISPSWVLTTATCLSPLGPSDVVTVSLGSVDESRPALMIKTNDTRVHPKYTSVFNPNNIGLINLRHSVEMSDIIAPIALPRESQAYENFGVGRSATIAGWGIVGEEDNIWELPGHLHFGTAIIISDDECERLHSSTMYEAHLCAVGYGELPQTGCYGDFSSPMFLHDPIDRLDILVGILLLPNCDYELDFPSIWIRPQYYLDWISETTGIPIRP